MDGGGEDAFAAGEAVKLTPELLRVVDLLAEAKMHLLLAAQGTAPGTPEREREMGDLERCTKKAREYVNSIGGIEKLPMPLAVGLRTCELAIPRLRAQVPVEKS